MDVQATDPWSSRTVTSGGNRWQQHGGWQQGGGQQAGAWQQGRQGRGGLDAGRSAPPSARRVEPRTEGANGAIVDYEAFDDLVHDDEVGSGEEPRRGDKVFHQRYGRGVVERVELGEPVKITAKFPGYGSRKVLAQYLRFG
jgi:hypothetical protein